MSFKTFMIIKAIVCLAFGVLLVFFPGWLMGLMGAPLDLVGTYLARLYGAALLGTLMLTWFARGAVSNEARRPILVDLVVYDAIGFAVTTLTVLAGVLNWLGWGIAAVYAFLTAGSAYLLAKKA
jgi:hypothetical protein